MKLKTMEYKDLIEARLRQLCEKMSASAPGLKASMEYSLMAGGKRLRPILCLEFCRVCGGDPASALDAACAIEMIHTYSLIHDDLPCMDNDSLRRGKPTNHIVFGECTATLAGDALQPLAFETILSSPLSPERAAHCALILSHAAGCSGMCAGQWLDMEGEGKVLTEKQLTEINNAKTGALIAASCMMGVAAAGGSPEQLSAAEEFGLKLGLAFQIRDGMLDVLSTDEALGKPVGSDAAECKNTYMALLGEEGCASKIRSLTAQAVESLKNSFENTACLEELANALETRIK